MAADAGLTGSFFVLVMDIRISTKRTGRYEQEKAGTGSRVQL